MGITRSEFASKACGVEHERLCERSKRDSSTAQADNPAGAGLKSRSVGLLRSE